MTKEELIKIIKSGDAQLIKIAVQKYWNIQAKLWKPYKDD